MGTFGKVVDSVVIVGSVAVGYGAIKTIIGGAKIKSTGTIALGAITLLIGVYALREAVNKIND
ncbi:MAG: hypothetical protein IPJ01_11925 [Micavibrio sp.]|nr:hypothetical protein [Micavibrio sp.]